MASKVFQANQPKQTVFATTPTIPASLYNAQRFDQIVRIGFQVAGHNFVLGTSAATGIRSAAGWTTKLAATDNTRIVLSPPFSNSKISMSKALQTNPDSNATYRGVPIYFDEGYSEFSCEFLDMDAAVIDAFAQVVSPMSFGTYDVVANSIVGYWCNNNGDIFGTPTFGGLPVQNLSFRTRGGNGLNSSDVVGMTFWLPPNWDGGATLPTPFPYVATDALAVDLRTIAF